MRYHVSSVIRVARKSTLRLRRATHVIERPVFVRPARYSWICRVLPIRSRRQCLEVAIRQEWCQRAWLFIYVLAQHGGGVFNSAARNREARMRLLGNFATRNKCYAQIYQ